jgi:hypothetical protein
MATPAITSGVSSGRASGPGTITSQAAPAAAVEHDPLDLFGLADEAVDNQKTEVVMVGMRRVPPALGVIGTAVPDAKTPASKPLAASAVPRLPLVLTPAGAVPSPALITSIPAGRIVRPAQPRQDSRPTPWLTRLVRVEQGPDATLDGTVLDFSAVDQLLDLGYRPVRKRRL